MATQYLIRGELWRGNGNVIPKFAYIFHGEVITCEHLQPCCYVDTKAQAEKTMEELSRHVCYSVGMRNWRIVAVPALVQPEIKVVEAPERTPRQWYRLARRAWSCYQDALGGGILESDSEEVWTTWAAWMTIPAQFRLAARATARPSANTL